ncbi:Murein DD-endopeptidase MepM [Paenibacillus konkukensis]|uniref:Murein DD-endopeptidase MepM n=1 Tax=Paenibacillus konkukensis TaxID=2020716 RepID=A0ABY4RT99_9BACL|nr:M23 family metallopeptidase [Paenibacillus konkukensis]UQZ85210.1 Murein DD-endopeptidase MepM [Paenibacillus konkukensis]
MRFKWFQNKLTFVIIPEANESVMRLKLSRASVCAAALSFLILLGTAVCVYVAHVRAVVTTQMTESRQQAHTSRLEQDLNNKNKAIEQLQKEIFQLSRQAVEVRSKVEEMKKLERELKKLSSMNDGPSSEAAAVSADWPAMELVQGGMGGPAHPVTAQQVRTLARETHASYDSLRQEISELKDRWVQSKQTILEQREQAQRRPGLWPTGSRTVTSPFGYRKDPFTDKLSFHRGIDIAGKLNDPVLAAAKGTAVTVGYDKFHGHNVVVEHGNGLRTWYMHLNEALVKQGDGVERGQEIGKIGSTGRSTGPHLHYEILHNGKSIDPKPYLPGS